MRTRSAASPRTSLLASVLLAAVALVGCGKATDRAADSGPLPTNLASVEVTYYYLPG